MNLEEQRTSCPGFLDEYGIWNNGFECPSVFNQIHVCCGSDSRRYCCALQSPTKSSSSTNEMVLSLLRKIPFAYLTVPVQLSLIVVLILLFLLIFLIGCRCYRSHRRKTQSFEQPSNKQTSFDHHFPFSPPHHRLITKDTLTTSTSSSSAVRLPSEIYLNDWKDQQQQSMNIYPTISTHQYEKHQQNDILV